MGIKYFALLVAMVGLCQGRKKDTIPLKAPKISGLSLLGEKQQTLTLAWNKIISPDKLDPVVLYKVSLWRVKKIKQIDRIVTGNNKVKRVQRIELQPLGANTNIKDRVVELRVPAKNETIIQYRGLKQGTAYDIRLQAFTKKGKASLLRQIRVKLAPLSKI